MGVPHRHGRSCAGPQLACRDDWRRKHVRDPDRAGDADCPAPASGGGYP